LGTDTLGRACDAAMRVLRRFGERAAGSDRATLVGRSRNISVTPRADAAGVAVDSRISTLRLGWSALLGLALLAGCATEARRNADEGAGRARQETVQLGPRPFFLLGEMRDGPLRAELSTCADGPFRRSDFSIGHRGAPLQFPEHTRESYEAAARMGAGILECDVTFTLDLQLVCRHAQDDLHRTTNILLTPLAAKCIVPFRPAVLDAAGNLLEPARAECRTSDLTLAEFKSLRGRIDGFNARARTPAESMAGTVEWRTDLYAGPTSGTLLSHAESIELFKRLGVKMTPELKPPVVSMPFEGLSRRAYAQQLIDEYESAGVPPEHVWPQSFDIEDVLYWIRHEPAFGRQAVFLDDARHPGELPAAQELARYKSQGINVWAPPLFALLKLDDNNRIVPSDAARAARAAGLEIITWTVERSGLLADGGGGFYYQTVGAAIEREGDVLEVLDVLARQVGVRGVFSDWPATVTYYANCTGLP